MRYPAAYITGILLPDGWHTVAGNLSVDWEPSIFDAATGVDATPVGGAWMRFTEPDGTITALPLRSVLAFQHKKVPSTVNGAVAVTLGAAVSAA